MGAYLIELSNNFWISHIEPKIPPTIDGSSASTRIVSMMFPKAQETKEIELPDEFITHVEDYLKYEKEIAEIETKRNLAENQLKLAIGENEIAYAGAYTIRWKNVESKRIDTKRIKLELPDIYEKYAKKSTSRRFDIVQPNVNN